MASKRKVLQDGYYDPGTLCDAPEHYDYSRGLGILTWGTWDHGLRPAEQRINDFVAAFPPDNPVRFSPGGSLVRQKDGSYAPGTADARLARFVAQDWRPGSIHELLARYALRAPDAPPFRPRSFVAASMRDTARRRNHRLRVLHGGVDIEPKDMDVAKAEFIDLQEKKKAAQEVREALKRMKDELDAEPDERK